MRISPLPSIAFTTKSQGEGTGLGLYIAHQIIERHCGTITVDSTPGKTTFEVHLPLNLPE
jgi:signal transduction histidine kinase